MPRYRVHLVVDRAIRGGNNQWPAGEPLWIVETAANEPFLSEVRQERDDLDHLIGVTTFGDTPGSTPEDLVTRMLPIIDQHHGEYSADPPYDSLHVIGARKSADLVAAAQAFGFVEVSGRDFDFELRMPETPGESR